MKDFFEFIFTKKIPSQQRFAYFKNEDELDSVKTVTARKEIIRSEWCSLLRRYVDLIMSKVTQDGVYICVDRSSKEMVQEIARYIHQSMFYGKSFLVYQEAQTGATITAIIPSVACLVHDIQYRLNKNKGNIKYYKDKGKAKRKQKLMEKPIQSVDSDDEDKENNGGGEVL